MSTVKNEIDCAQVNFYNEAHDLDQYSEKKRRELFYYLLNVDEYSDVLPTAKKLVVTHFKNTKNIELITNKKDAINYLCSVHKEVKQKFIGDLSKENIAYLIQQLAPTALTDGVWLQNIGSIVHCHTEISAVLFQLYSYKVGDFKCEHNHYNLYSELLQSIFVRMPKLNSFSFVTQAQIIDSSFTLPVYYLALSQFPRLFLPEIIGVTLAHMFAGYDQLFLSLDEIQKHKLPTTYFTRQPFYQNDLSNNIAISEKILDAFFQEPTSTEADWRRIWKGFASVFNAAENNKQQLLEILRNPINMTPKQKMIAIIKNKAPYSRGHHRETLIGDKTLPEWFDKEEFNVDDFLNALANSPFVDRKSPEKSLFFTQLISFGGPMFRVFTEEEIEVIKLWMSELPDKEDKNTVVVCPYQKKHNSKISQHKKKKLAKVHIRDLYYYLVNVDIYPDTNVLAKQFTQMYMNKTQRYMRFFPKMYRLFPYTHEAFSDRIHDIYNYQVSLYKEFKAPPKFSKEAYHWLMYQLAPLVLVDGCWLQNVARSGTSHTPVSAFLFNTFSDEIGNGDTEWNHANVYRELLKSEQAILPEFNTKDFAHDKKITTAAFDLPVLQLAISQTPKTFQPELIGLNLAIEMGGLGWEYMTFVDELTYWDIDPYIVSLHISIDNMATGHTAWAMESVQIYLDQVLTEYGQDEMQRQWKRIWTGYLSYKMARIPLQINIVKQFIKDTTCKFLGLRKKTK